MNEEQLAALASKASLERSLAEYEAIKVQLEEIAASQVNASAPAPAKVCVEASTATQQTHEMTSQAVQTVPPSATTATTSTGSSQGSASSQQLQGQSLKKLLKALHVYCRYRDYTGLTLPDEVELFGMAILGLSSVSDFDDRVAQSARTAALYLDVSKIHSHSYILSVWFCSVLFCYRSFWCFQLYASQPVLVTMAILYEGIGYAEQSLFGILAV